MIPNSSHIREYIEIAFLRNLLDLLRHLDVLSLPQGSLHRLLRVSGAGPGAREVRCHLRLLDPVQDPAIRVEAEEPDEDVAEDRLSPGDRVYPPGSGS